MADTITLPVFCSVCGGPTTLELDADELPDATREWRCPHCEGPQSAPMEHRIAAVRKGHDDTKAAPVPSADEKTRHEVADYLALVARERDADSQFKNDLIALGLTTEDQVIAWLRTIKPLAKIQAHNQTPDQWIKAFARAMVVQANKERAEG